MKTEERRKEIALLLKSQNEPVSGGELSKKFGVSRQIIVQDITSLKNSGYEIISTHNGYFLLHAPLSERVFKSYHTSDGTEKELNLIVDCGGTVFDEFVWHKVYGKMAAKLNISNKKAVKQFIDGVRSGKSVELMNITGGYHYHTVVADSEEVLDTIEKALNENGFIVPEIAY